MQRLDSTVLDVKTEQVINTIASPSRHLKQELLVCSATKKKDKILEALKQASLTEKEIFLRCGESWHVRSLVRDLLRDGLIFRAGQGGQKDPFMYRAQINKQ